MSWRCIRAGATHRSTRWRNCWGCPVSSAWTDPKFGRRFNRDTSRLSGITAKPMLPIPICFSNASNWSVACSMKHSTAANANWCVPRCRKPAKIIGAIFSPAGSLSVKLGPVSPAVRVESLDQEGRGVAHVDGKVIFIEGALTGETVEYVSFQRKPSYELAVAKRVIRASVSRVQPRCRYFGVCGGCSMQHLEPRAQVAAKQRVLEDNLARIGKVTPETILSPIHGPTWQYRYRARFSARHVAKKGTLVGFRERRSSFVVDMQTCEVVPARTSALLVPLRELIASLSIRERLPQVELAIGDAVDVLVLRVIEAPDDSDLEKLRQFATRHGVQLLLQPKGPDSVYSLFPQEVIPLQYRIPDFDLTFPFNATDFTQVNHEINRVLVRRAITLLDRRRGDWIADLFCGLGNFSLAIARRGAQVLGIEGNSRLVQRAYANATLNGLEDRCRFLDRDLFKITADGWNKLGPFDRILIDPPRDGAIELVKALGAMAPARIVYVSCNPATLARDAAVLGNEHAYRLGPAGGINMFPHTPHRKSNAVLGPRSNPRPEKGAPAG